MDFFQSLLPSSQEQYDFFTLNWDPEEEVTKGEGGAGEDKGTPKGEGEEETEPQPGVSGEGQTASEEVEEGVSAVIFLSCINY